MEASEIKKIADLARLELNETETPAYAKNMTNILGFAAEINKASCEEVQPMAHPLDISQRLRDDKVTAQIDRKAYQNIAPETEAGLYLVPIVIDSEE